MKTSITKRIRLVSRIIDRKHTGSAKKSRFICGSLSGIKAVDKRLVLPAQATKKRRVATQNAIMLE